MAQITREMCESIINGFETKKGFALTNWEAAQLAYAWLERDEARKGYGAVMSRLNKLEGGGCTCGTKTPDIIYHAYTCRYRIVVELQTMLAKWLGP